jgi:spoIIIJ-associated protein
VDVPQSIEAVGANIEDAIARGLEALNAERRNVEIEVMTAEPGREARVRLTIKSHAAVPASISTTSSIQIEEAAPAEEAISSEDMTAAQRVLATLLRKMKLAADVEAHQAMLPDERHEGPTLVLDIRGEDLSNLIGRRGETLDNLQYLTRLLVAKEVGQYLNLVLDVEGYKSHREQMLQQLARRMAERVTQTHKPAALEPMPAAERRIVHLTLRDHPHVRTESVGSGENRKVTIVPKTTGKR